MKTNIRCKLLQLIIILFLILSNSILYGQVKLEAYFGVSGRNDASSDILEMYDKGYYITGGFENGNNNYNEWNIKTNVNLEFVYDKVIENSLSTIAPFSSISDNNGNVYITGFMNYPDQWPFITKIDSCGNKQWCKVMIYEDEFNYGWANDLVLTDNDEVVLLVTLVNNEQPAEQINMTHLIGISYEGDVLWKKPYASRNDHSWIRQPIGKSIIKVNNEYYISGSCDWPYPDDTTHWFLRPLFIGIDSLFEEKWILPFAPLDSVFGYAFKSIPLNDSVFIGIGERWLEGNTKNTILMFYDKDGEELGYNQIPNDSIGPNVIANVSRDIERLNDSLFITFSVWGSTPDGGICSEMVIDTSGKIYSLNESTYCIGSGSLIKTYDNKYVYAVTVEETKSDWDIYVYKIDENLNDVPFDPIPHNYDSLCPTGIQSGTIDLTSCFIWTDIGDAPSSRGYYSFIKTIPVKAYPNPVNGGEVTFEFENTEHLTPTPPLVPPGGGKPPHLCIYNVFGEKVHEEMIYRYQGKSIVDINGWQKGMYFGVVYSDGKSVGRCKFVVQ